MLGTASTPYDLKFRMLDIPVRIHPFFWLVTACLGWENNNLPAVFVWVVCVFVSILVHEYGHGLMAKRFHGSPSIVLYGLGGLCASSGERTDGQRIAVLIAGPGAGFVLCGIVMAISSLAFGITIPEHLGIITSMIGLNPERQGVFGVFGKLPSETAFEIYYHMIWINLMWGLVNLLPIWPLDGGQILQVGLARFDPRQGVRRSHIVSLLTAGLVAVISISINRHTYFVAILFGMLAFLNYQVLQSLQQARSFGVYQDDDWWRR
jgi:membrane-associated protease RseP (regulator of RpoE activity)